MTLSKDWREFLELLNSRGVDYVIVGAQSLAFHGRPRHTGDLDIPVRPTPENARLLLALPTKLDAKVSAIIDGIPVFVLGREALIRISER